MSKRPLFLAIMILSVIAITISIASNAFVIFANNMNAYIRVSAGLSVIALFFGLYYVLQGSKKDAAKFFKYFLIAFAVAQLSLVVGSTQDASFAPFFAGANAVILAGTVLLAFGKDLGKKFSYGISITMLVLAGIKFILCLTAAQEIISTYGTLGGILYIFVGFAGLTLTAVVLIMEYAKFTDKEARGRKV